MTRPSDQLPYTLAPADLSGDDYLWWYDVSAGRIVPVDADALLGWWLRTQENFTGNDTLLAAESGKLCTNIGASGVITLTAPTATVGMIFGTLRVPTVRYPIRWQPATGNYVEDGLVNKYVEQLTSGLLVYRCFVANYWSLIHRASSWAYQL